MHAKLVTLTIVLVILLQLLGGMVLQTSYSQPKNNYSEKKLVNNKISKESSGTTPIHYKLEAYSIKSEYTLGENIEIAIILFNLDTWTYILDSVTVTTPLGSRIIQLTDIITQVTLGKEDFVSGINSITVTYKDQIKTFQILRQDFLSKGPTSTTVVVNDILNSQPAPGVPDYINYTVTNNAFVNFPTDGDYIQVSLTFQGITLVLQSRFYPLNSFIQNDLIKFAIPIFLSQTSYDLSIYYSGNNIFAPATTIETITVNNFTPIISSNLPNTLLDKTDVLNNTSSFLQVKIEGYLPAGLQVTIHLNNSITLLLENITDYRQLVPIAVATTQATGNYTLSASFNYTNTIPAVVFTYTVQVVEKMGLIIRTDTTFLTLGNPVLFDFFCYNPTSFAGVRCTITMMNGSKSLMVLQTSTGHIDQSVTFTNLDTAKTYLFDFKVETPDQQLYPNTVPYAVHFYHNTSIDVVLQKNIVDRKQLISLQADTSGRFIIKDINNLIIGSFDYSQIGQYVNYFITFNDTHRGLNSYQVYFTPKDQNYSNVSKGLDVYVYDTITIQNVQTNASFYQLGTYILMKGVATITNIPDSLNNVTVSLLLDGVLLKNTTILSNEFTFIIPAPNSTGLKKFQVAIYANDKQFILTSTAFELTISVINNFGLSYANRTYQVGDTIKLQIYGLEGRAYSLYYELNEQKTVLSNFTYSQAFTFDLSVKKFGHYLIYLEETSTGEKTYYGVNVFQNPTANLKYGVLETYKNNSLTIELSNYQGQYRYKIDNLFQSYDSYNNNGTGSKTIQMYNVRLGNHSLTLLLDNQYTVDKVRTYYFIIYQNIELTSVSYSGNSSRIVEEDSVTMHLKFKDFSNVSLNDVAIQIETNDNTILAQANIFNSASDFQMTVLGDNLSLVVLQNDQLYIHEETLPLNLTVYHLLSSDIRNYYSYNTVATVKISFMYKYFPVPTKFTMDYMLRSGTKEQSNTSVGQTVQLKLSSNGKYNLSILVSCAYCINRTFQTKITVQKLFDLSNTGLLTVVGIMVAIPVIVAGLTILRKRKNVW